MLFDLNYGGKVMHFKEALHPRLVRVLHHHEMYGLSFPEWQAKDDGKPLTVHGLPEIVPLVGVDTGFIPLTESLQLFGFRLLQTVAPDWSIDDLIRAYVWLMDGNTAFTNHVGSGTLACYISGQNLDQEPMKQEAGRVCGGAHFELADPNPMRYFGEWVYKIKAINVYEPLPDPRTWKQNFWAFRAVVSRWDRLADGRIQRRVDEFPQLGGLDVPVPLLSRTGYQYIKCSNSVIVYEDEPITSSYVAPFV